MLLVMVRGRVGVNLKLVMVGVVVAVMMVEVLEVVVVVVMIKLVVMENAVAFANVVSRLEPQQYLLSFKQICSSFNKIQTDYKFQRFIYFSKFN